MKKVDDLIIELAGHINDLIKNGGECEHEIAEKTKALAALIIARAEMV